MSRCYQRHLYGRHTLHDLTCTLACLELIERFLTEKYIRAVFKWLSKVITWLRSLRSMIGLKDSRQFFNQWEEKAKPIAPCTRHFFRALRELQVISRNCDWFIALFAPVVIGRSDCLGFGFSTVIWKPFYYCTCARLLDYFFVSEQGCPYNIRVFLSGSALRDLLRGIWFFLSISTAFAFSWTCISIPIYDIFALCISPFSPRGDPLHTASVSPSPLLQGKCDSLSLSHSKMTAEAKCLIGNRLNQLVNVMTFMLFSWILQAYKQGMYGPKYVWVLFSGRNQANWWKQQSHLVDCTPEQVRKGLSNNIGTGELQLSPLPGPTICGRVPILTLVHTCDLATQSLLWKKCFWSVVERWIEEVILTLAGQSQWLPHICTWKISGVFIGIRTHDLCKCEDHFLSSSPTTHFFHSSFVSRKHLRPRSWLP